MATVLEELPLIRSKNAPLVDSTATGPNVGPGSYDISFKNPCNDSRAPFNTTSQRPPLSLIDPRVPGPGAYTIMSPEGTRGVASCPFASENSRFPLSSGEGVPGPGSYNTNDRWPTKKAPRAHQFRTYDEPDYAGEAPGPGYYSPDGSRKPAGRTAHFGKYSERDAERPNANPGPGTYDPGVGARSLYSTKPSSMFATNTKRLQPQTGCAPGPGSYEVPSAFDHKRKTERFSGFGSSASRFGNGNDTTPGPGTYTGEIAPRRPRPVDGYGTYPFASDSNRFNNTALGYPGPGSYDDSKLPKHLQFGGQAPFGSTVPRFGGPQRPAPAVDAFSGTAPLRIPRRVMPQRMFIERDIYPSTAAETLPDRSYDVNYDWPKPTSLRSTFGTGPRFTGADNADAVPGPGSYNSYGGPGGLAARPMGNSAWGREVRFPGSTHKGNPGPGSYYHETTFLYKTYNQTIGSDAVYM